MKIQIQNLEPNPYRDMSNYPIDQEKIQSLKNSIEQTGFWDNILARQSNGKFQIAYGHHRLEVLKQVLKPTDEIDIPVKKLSDALMIKIMAKENDNDWQTNVAITDETVRVTKKFLEENTEEINNFHTGVEKSQWSKESFKIANFLDWSEHKVFDSLQRIGMIKSGKIEKDVIESMPHEKAAKRFTSAVKKYPEVTIPEQRTIAEKLHKEDSFDERSISDSFLTTKWKKPEKKPEFKSEKIRSFENFIGGLRNDTLDLYEDLRRFVRLENEIGEYEKSAVYKLFYNSLKTLNNQINLILNENEKNESTDTDSPSAGGQLKS